MSKAKSWFSDGVSIDETRVSFLILGFLVTLGFAMWQVVDIGEINDNLLTLLGYEITAITGINIADKITRKYSSNDEVNG